MSEVKLCNPENFRLGANPFLAGSLRCDPPAQSHFTRKSAITEYYVSGSPSTPNGPLTPRKNVLTAKKGLFLEVSAGKQEFGAEKKTLYFALFHVLALACVSKLLSVRNLQRICGSKKNRAEKPTIGF